MKKHSLTLLLASLLMVICPASFAQEDIQQNYDAREQSYDSNVNSNSAIEQRYDSDVNSYNTNEQRVNSDVNRYGANEQSYGTKIGHKALNGFANMTTATLEIPKNIINTINQSNVAYGMVGGLAKGILNTVGRMFTGLVDFITFPMPTKPIVYPAYVWDDFDVDSVYGDVYRLDEKSRHPHSQPQPQQP